MLHSSWKSVLWYFSQLICSLSHPPSPLEASYNNTTFRNIEILVIRHGTAQARDLDCNPFCATATDATYSGRMQQKPKKHTTLS